MERQSVYMFRKYVFKIKKKIRIEPTHKKIIPVKYRQHFSIYLMDVTVLAIFIMETIILRSSHVVDPYVNKHHAIPRAYITVCFHFHFFYIFRESDFKYCPLLFCHQKRCVCLILKKYFFFQNRNFFCCRDVYYMG